MCTQAGFFAGDRILVGDNDFYNRASARADDHGSAESVLAVEASQSLSALVLQKGCHRGLLMCFLALLTRRGRCTHVRDGLGPQDGRVHMSRVILIGVFRHPCPLL